MKDLLAESLNYCGDKLLHFPQLGEVLKIDQLEFGLCEWLHSVFACLELIDMGTNL
jgi:hypothetical protein